MISITLVIVGITCLISYMAFNNPAMRSKLAHNPYAEARNKEYSRFLTSGFVHGGWFHLLINMFVLWQFGEAVEGAFKNIFGPVIGMVTYIAFYLLCIIFANISTFIKHRDNYAFSSVGASGAVSGILAIFAMFAPWHTILLYGIVPIPVIIGLVLYLVYSSWASNNSQDMIDHDAHFYGAVFGIVFLFTMKPSLATNFFEKFMAGLPF